MPKPPGIGGQPSAAPGGSPGDATQEDLMELEGKEAPLEELIAEQEEFLKFIRGKDSPFFKTEKSVVESKLKELKERQRQARPLPARLQAATDRFAKAKQLFDEGEAKAAAAEEAAKVARQELSFLGDKLHAAYQELDEVKKAAAAEPVGLAEKGLAGSMEAALPARSIIGPEA